jgi:hypothetical protein
MDEDERGSTLETLTFIFNLVVINVEESMHMSLIWHPLISSLIFSVRSPPIVTLMSMVVVAKVPLSVQSGI